MAQHIFAHNENGSLEVWKPGPLPPPLFIDEAFNQKSLMNQHTR